MKKISIVIGGLLLCATLYAKDNVEKIGNILQIAIPLSAYGTTLYLDDNEGQMEFYKSYGVSLASTYALKYTVTEQRPDSNAKDSFPSGHTSSAFSGATFIHKRYGLKYAIVPYLGAIYTGLIWLQYMVQRNSTKITQNKEGELYAKRRKEKRIS